MAAVNFALSGKQSTLWNNLLYAHSTIVPDPIAQWYFDRFEELAKTPPVEWPNGLACADQSEWMGWLFSSYGAFKWNTRASREALLYFVARLLPLKPLAKAGMVVLVSQAHLLLEKSEFVVSEALLDAADTEFQRVCDQPIDEKLPLWDNHRGGIMTPGGIQADQALTLWAQAKEAAYHIRKNMMIAAACGGIYVPDKETDWALLRRIVVSSGLRKGYDAWQVGVASRSIKLQIPSLERIPLKELVKVRENEGAFAEFRLWLARRLFASHGESATAVQDITSGEIEREIQKLKKQLRTSSTIKRYLRENGFTIGVDALLGMAASNTIGEPLLGAVGAS